MAHDPGPTVPSAGPADAAARAAFEAEALALLADVLRFARMLARDDALADDLVQDTYLRALEKWTQFTPGTDLRAWLFTLCRHRFLRGREREARVVSVGDDPAEDALATVLLHAEAPERAEALLTRLDLAPALARAFASLPVAFREVAHLVDVEGLTYEEVATLLGVPVGTVRSRLFRARRLLQRELLAVAEDSGLMRRSDDA